MTSLGNRLTLPRLTSSNVLRRKATAFARLEFRPGGMMSYLQWEGQQAHHALPARTVVQQHIELEPSPHPAAPLISPTPNLESHKHMRERKFTVMSGYARTFHNLIVECCAKVGGI